MYGDVDIQVKIKLNQNEYNVNSPIYADCLRRLGFEIPALPHNDISDSLRKVDNFWFVLLWRFVWSVKHLKG